MFTRVKATAHIRKMRGGAQAHLMKADDGHFYVVKFQNNPQHRRVLINEFIASFILKHLGICSPEIAILQVDEAFLRANPGVYLSLKNRNIAVKAGLHFGSRYPGDPSRMPVYDFLPNTMLLQVLNLHELRGMLAFDKWVCNLDYRQAIFFRARVRTGSSSAKLGFVASMIDNGFAFGGTEWEFSEAPLTGLHANRAIYSDVRSIYDFEPWLHKIARFPEDLLRRAFQAIPAEWLATDGHVLQQMSQRLLSRRGRVADLVSNCWSEMQKASGATGRPSETRVAWAGRKGMDLATSVASLRLNRHARAAVIA